MRRELEYNGRKWTLECNPFKGHGLLDTAFKLTVEDENGNKLELHGDALPELEFVGAFFKTSYEQLESMCSWAESFAGWKDDRFEEEEKAE